MNWENDALRNSDRHYTQGLHIGYLSSDTGAPGWLRRFSEFLPALGFEAAGLKYGFEIGQEMYTPEDLDAPDVIADDRPYAGWLYGAALLQRRGRGLAGVYAMETLRLELGVVGKESMAEQTQKVWHGRDPRGWDNQLETEPGLCLRYDRDYLFRWRNWGRWDLDALPGLDAALGNIDIHLGVRATVRAGYNIPNRHEVPGRKTPKSWGAYMFVTGGVKAVAHSIFLDGNTWEDSHSVEPEPFVASLVSGINLVLGSVELLAANHYISHDFRGQRHSDSYGAISLIYKF
jgi:lipid A 3-O-deacylase